MADKHIPVTLHSRGGQIVYAATQSRADLIANADRFITESAEAIARKTRQRCTDPLTPREGLALLLWREKRDERKLANQYAAGPGRGMTDANRDTLNRLRNQ